MNILNVTSKSPGTYKNKIISEFSATKEEYNMWVILLTG